ncbi:unnamed protein product [Protopolystoma xenopodis]|uniref:Uncharacterized protein n=1 Tax=Protopolystoma xenopodis TaxID=117903 RepID=A0A3S5C9L9_9PLAT|nr:unnamed protein product [Protopolystoma xenopodis]
MHQSRLPTHTARQPAYHRLEEQPTQLGSRATVHVVAWIALCQALNASSLLVRQAAGHQVSACDATRQTVHIIAHTLGLALARIQKRLTPQQRVHHLNLHVSD